METEQTQKMLHSSNFNPLFHHEDSQNRGRKISAIGISKSVKVKKLHLFFPSNEKQDYV